MVIIKDTKTKIKMGEFSRGDRLRCFEAVKALDYNMIPNGTLIPFGILEVKQKQFNVVYGNSRETSDFIVDGLRYWWRYNKHRYRASTKTERYPQKLDTPYGGFGWNLPLFFSAFWLKFAMHCHGGRDKDGE